jgi:manganese catalase
MLLTTATEEIAHIGGALHCGRAELEASKAVVEKGVGASNPAIQAILGGMDPRHYLSADEAALPVNSNGVPFDMTYLRSGNLAADVYANVAAEATGARWRAGCMS